MSALYPAAPGLWAQFRPGDEQVLFRRIVGFDEDWHPVVVAPGEATLILAANCPGYTGIWEGALPGAPVTPNPS